MSQFRALLFAVVLTGLPLMLAAAPVPVLRVVDLERDADTIVIGYVDHVDDLGPAALTTDNGAAQGRLMEATIFVNRTIKGEDATALTVTFFATDQFIGYERITASGDYRMFFLKGSAQPLRFTSPYYASVISAENINLTAQAPLDRVFEALGSVANASSAAVPVRMEALYGLHGSPNAFALRALDRALSDSDGSIRLTAAAGLLASGDVRALPMAVSALNGNDAGASEQALANLAAAISHGVKDRRAVPALGKLLTSGNIEGRRAAAQALRDMRAPAAFDALVASLSDTDRNVRFTAVAALAEMTGETSWLPSMDRFWGNEGPFIEHWRSHPRP